jgi:hypothetical protein
MRKMLAFAVAALLLAAAFSVTAAGPTDAPGTATGRPARLTAQAGFAGTEETTIAGQVVDKSGKPVADATVKLYLGGLLVTEVMTSLDGSFEIVELIDYGRDVTVDMWFVPADDQFVMENVLLKESSAALQHRLYSPCVARIRLDPLTDMIVRLYDIDARNAKLQKDGCIR